ncbi:MAG: 23S rRNA (pseudouridine(1915)-N(3))-methyltransferase RlmH [Chloroflexi bacterium]|nr:23S rRNA (pseudouridine(1915)-N(3))-methyltransferase RlmH [Chloroflexota bacterium]
MPYPSGHITVAAVGKIRKSHWKTALDDYEKRLRRYTDFKLVEVKDAVGRGGPEATAVAKEGEALLRAAKGARRLIALTENGRQMDSPRLARYLMRQVQLYGRIAFLIAGPLGFSDDVLIQCDEQLSLSPMTFPHELARVILLEQLYRACTILNGEKYHK